MAKSKKPKKIKYAGTYDPATDKIKWTSPVAMETNPTNPPPPPSKP